MNPLLVFCVLVQAFNCAFLIAVIRYGYKKDVKPKGEGIGAFLMIGFCLLVEIHALIALVCLARA